MPQAGLAGDLQVAYPCVAEIELGPVLKVDEIDPLTGYVGAVRAPKIPENRSFGCDLDDAMLPRDGRVGEGGCPPGCLARS